MKLKIIKENIDEELDKDDEDTVKTIIGKLKKASKAHAGQAKQLSKDLQDDKELDEQFDFVLLDKDNKIVARASGKNAKKEMESSKRSAHLPPMRIPKNEVGKMKIVPISPRDKKDIGDMVLAIGEEVKLDELKMNDPKLLKVFDKLKPRDTIQLKVSSSIAKGKDFQPYTVRSKNTLRNGVEKITMILQGNPTGVKRFLYKKDGKVTFAIGDMGASIDDIKESLDKKDAKTFEEYSHIKEMIQSGKFTRPEIKKMIERNILEKKAATGYTIFHKTFSDAMQHAYAHRKE